MSDNIDMTDHEMPGQPFFSGDILAAGPIARSPKRRLAPVLTSITVVAAIVLGGGAFTAVKLLASKGSQPDEWAPANSLAFAKVDLDPSASAKVAAWEFEQKFPDAPKVVNADQLKDGLLTSAFDDTHGAVDYATDIKPWLGDRAAMAVFLDSTGKPAPIYILQIKDAAKASASLTRLVAAASTGNPEPGSDGTDGVRGFSLQSGYAILAASQEIVDEAVATAKKADIDSNSTYNSDIAQLKSDRVVTAWWDAGATLKAVSSELGDQAGAVLTPGSLTDLGSLSNAGRIVTGLRVEPSYVELEGRILGSSASTQLKSGDAGATLGDLPGGTVAGISLSNPEQLIKTELESLSKGPLGSKVQQEMDQLGAQLGISLPGDIENLLGSELAVGVDALPDADQALGGIFVTAMTHPDDLQEALQTAKALIAGAGADAGVHLSATANGSSLVVTDDARPASGKLSDDPGFRAALEGMPSKAVAAGYVDLSTVLAARPDTPPGLSPLQSLGFYFATDSTSPVFAVRLTVK